jgi:TetR/AcrR family transcriptional regulator, transcriptional repressor for nem operon
MPSHAGGTRERMMDAAEGLFLEHGYGGTSVDMILERTALTKGAFFHHFASKHELARALIERYAAADQKALEEHLARAERLSRDPLQQVLILVGLYAEEMEGSTDPHRGCLFASYSYQAGLFDAEVHDVIRVSLVEWQAEVRARLEAGMIQHPPRVPVEAGELVELLLAIIEGSFILSRTLGEPEVGARQLRQYRTYLELLFGLV